MILTPLKLTPDHDIPAPVLTELTALYAANETFFALSGDFPDPADPDPWIGLLMVSEHRKGHGRRIAEAVEEGFRRAGRDAVRLAVLENNPAGTAFWTSLGYEEIDRRKDRQLGRPCAVLRKTLAN